MINLVFSSQIGTAFRPFTWQLPTLDPPPVANILGLLALIGYGVTLFPTLIRKVFPSYKLNISVKQTLKHRREIGVITFWLALGHGLLLIHKRYVDFADFKTFWVYFQGTFTLGIFALLAITSNNWCIKALKHRWKQLHQLTYVAMFLLLWHVLDKMAGHWSYITPLALILIAGITLLFLYRLKIEESP